MTLFLFLASSIILGHLLEIDSSAASLFRLQHRFAISDNSNLEPDRHKHQLNIKKQNIQ